jgi:hypothetical protein
VARYECAIYAKPARAPAADGVSKGGGGVINFEDKSSFDADGGHGAIRPGCSGWRLSQADVMRERLFLQAFQKGNLGIPPPIPGMPFIPSMPPSFFIIFIMPPPFIFFIMSRIWVNSLSKRLTS